ncbi:hypothetical protein WAH63_23070, partial [Acinetobacter baumannii]
RRGRIETDDSNAEINATVFDLLTVFQKILLRHKEQVKMEIEREEVSLAEMIDRLRQRLSSESELNLFTFFGEMRSR